MLDTGSHSEALSSSKNSLTNNVFFYHYRLLNFVYLLLTILFIIDVVVFDMGRMGDGASVLSACGIK